MEEKLLRIYKYGDDILKLKAKEIKNIDKKIAELSRYMAKTMYYTGNGIGLAAPQVGKSIQLSIIDLSMGTNPADFLVLINPQILEAEGSEVADEGCLSLPGFTMPVKRRARLLLRAFDLDGKEWRQEFEGFKARVVQHEIDHLNGVLIIDRVSSLKRQIIKKEIKKLAKDGFWD